MPLSSRFLEVLEDGDLFFPLSKWPAVAKEKMLKTHKDNNDRYYLMRFLCYNGLKPEIASNWVLREGQYDDNALRDQQAMIQKARGQEFYAKGRIFNMRYGRTDSIYDQPPPEDDYKESQPPTEYSKPKKIYTYNDLVNRYPPPVFDGSESQEERMFANAVWKAETRKYFKAMQQQGYTFVG